jgi:hypothetical protein
MFAKMSEYFSFTGIASASAKDKDKDKDDDDDDKKCDCDCDDDDCCCCCCCCDDCDDDDDDKKKLPGDNDWSTTAPSTNGPNKVNDLPAAGDDGKGPNLGCNTPILPLTASKTTVNNAINALTVIPRGGKFSNLGLIWAWRNLDPSWRGLWQAPSANPDGLPKDYNTSVRKKAVVLVMMGDNAWNDYATGYPGLPNGSKYPGADYTSFQRPGVIKPGGAANAYGITSVSAGLTSINTRTASVCSSMKTQGIQIYTIGVGAQSAATIAMLTTCASSPSNFFQATSLESLNIALDKISAGLETKLRLVK